MHNKIILGLQARELLAYHSCYPSKRYQSSGGPGASAAGMGSLAPFRNSLAILKDIQVYTKFISIANRANNTPQPLT